MLKVHLIKDNKGKVIRPRPWDTYCKLNVGEKLVGVTFSLFMAMEIEKGIGKAKRHQLEFIYENKRK